MSTEAMRKALEALTLLDEAFCADDYGTREGRAKGRAALVAARAAVAVLREALAAQAQAEPASFMLVPLSDGRDPVCPIFCKDEAAVADALLPLMFFLRPGEELDEDHKGQFQANLESLLEDGFLRFEGDAGIDLHRLTEGFTAPPAVKAEPLTLAAADVLAERRRQIEAEGWTPKHDDRHSDGSMALAAACYACNAATWAEHGSRFKPEDYQRRAWQGFRWPWDAKWWKPKSQRQDLIRAAALILAEIERLDRAAQKGGAA